MQVELVWRNPADHATTVSAGRVKQSEWRHGSTVAKACAGGGGRRVAVRQQDDAQVDRDWPEEGISAVSSVSSVRRTNASRRQEQLRVSSSEEPTRRPRDGFRERRPDAASVVLAAGTAQAREEQEAPQQQAPPDIWTSQPAKACLRREVPTDHEARGQALRRQLRRVATELRRDHDPEAGAKHAKHDRIRTQAHHQSRMTSVRGKQTDLHAQRQEGRARAAELWRSVRKRTRGSARGRANSLSKQGLA